MNLFFAVGITRAAGLVNCGGTGQTDCQIQDLVLLIQRIINFLLAWAWLVSVFLILWASWEMINAGGNQEGITKGKEGLKHAIIGFMLIMASYLLVNMVVSLLTGDGSPQVGGLEKILDFIRFK